MKALYLIILAQAITLAYTIFDIVRMNRRNGLFKMTVLQVYLMKYHGMNAEEAEDEFCNFIRCEKEISDEIKRVCITENYGRHEVAKYRQKHGLL